MGPMDNDRFQHIAGRYRELDAEQSRPETECLSLLYNTAGNSHHPQAFVSLEDALAHEDLTAQIQEIRPAKMKLANNASEDGFPADRWIRLEGADKPDYEATTIILREHRGGSYELQTDH